MTLSLDQITGSNFSYQNMTFEHFLDDMVALGRSHLEIWGIAQHFDVATFDFADARRLRQQLDDRDLDIVCLTPEQVMYPVNVASSVASIREASIALFRRAADICADLEIPLLFLTAGRGFEDESREEARTRAVDALRQTTSYAAEIGVTCVLEPLQRHESNLANNSSDLTRMLGEVGAPNLGVALDTVAMATAGETVDDYVRAFGDAIRHVHLIDGSPAGHKAWGDGELPLTEYLIALDRAGYTGYMSFEIFGADNGFRPRAAHEQSLRAVEAVLNSAEFARATAHSAEADH